MGDEAEMKWKYMDLVQEKVRKNKT